LGSPRARATPFRAPFPPIRRGQSSTAPTRPKSTSPPSPRLGVATAPAAAPANFSNHAPAHSGRSPIEDASARATRDRATTTGVEAPAGSARRRRGTTRSTRSAQRGASASEATLARTDLRAKRRRAPASRGWRLPRALPAGGGGRHAVQGPLNAER